ncbi:MAG: hypothetical protein J4G11_10750, partial [Acidimicrobiia bacterium]|nr:hypothetical protein [Acidimicrobiia bacterium]
MTVSVEGQEIDVSAISGPYLPSNDEDVDPPHMPGSLASMLRCCSESSGDDTRCRGPASVIRHIAI